MKYRHINGTNIQVSNVCLGTMTFGEYNTKEESFGILDYAIENGINFIDLAEMYPAPTKPETWGKSEKYVGSWMHQKSNRKDLVLCSKIAGPGEWISHIREGKTKFNLSHIQEAIEGSLRRLKTDYLDLYLIHWPERDVNMHGHREYQHTDSHTDFLETLEALNTIIKSGKTRAIGISNETPWGLMQYLSISENFNLPRIAVLQNQYNLLNRSFEIAMSEICYREKIGLMAYSPLAFGVLTGKYTSAQVPKGSRADKMGQMDRFINENSLFAADSYCSLANKHGLTPSQLALAYNLSKDFLLSCIVGCTKISQLKENLTAMDTCLSEEILNEINKIHENIPNPLC